MTEQKQKEPLNQSPEKTFCPACWQWTKSVRTRPFEHVCPECGNDKFLEDLYQYEIKLMRKR